MGFNIETIFGLMNKKIDWKEHKGSKIGGKLFGSKEKTQSKDEIWG